MRKFWFKKSLKNTKKSLPALADAARPIFEGLEERTMFAVSSLIDGGVLVVRGDASNDSITVQSANGFTTANGKSFSNSQFIAINIEPGDGDDTVNLLSSDRQVEIFSGEGNDTFKFGNGLMAFPENLTIRDESGTNTLLLDDSADTTFRSVKLSNLIGQQFIEGLSKGIASIGYDGVLSNLTINGGVSGNVFTVKETIPGINSITLNGGVGGDTFAVEKASSAMLLDGVNGQDVATLGLTRSASQITRDVTLSNTSGSFNLTVDDSGDPSKRNVSLDLVNNPANGGGFRDGVVTGVSGAAVRFKESEIRFLTLKASGGSNNVIIGDTPKNNLNVLTTVNTGVGSDTVEVRAAHGALTLEGGGGEDEVSLGRAGSTRNITGAVTIGNSNAESTATTLSIDDSADPTRSAIKISRSGNNGVIAGLGGAITYKGGQVDFVSIAAGPKGNTIDIADTAPNAPLTIRTGVGDDTINIQRNSAIVDIGGQRGSDLVNLGQNQNMTGLAQDVFVSSETGKIRLTLNDVFDTASRNIALGREEGATDIGVISGMAPGDIHYDRPDISLLEINAGSGGNNVEVQQTLLDGVSKTLLNTGAGADKVLVRRTDAPLLINGVDGRDTVTVSSLNHTLADIHGTIEVQNTKSFSSMTFDDSGDTLARNAKLSPVVTAANNFGGAITGLAPAKLIYSGSAVSAVNILAGSGGNTFTVLNTVVNSTTNAVTTINTGSGSDKVHVQRTSGALSIEGQDGNDSVDIGLKNNAQAIKGQVNINSARGTVSLVVNDQSDLLTHTVTLSSKIAPPNSPTNTSQASITGLTPAAIRYSPFCVSQVIVNAGDGDGLSGNTFFVDGTAPGLGGFDTAVTFVRGGASNDTFVVKATDTQLTLIEGEGDDQVFVGSDTNTLDNIKGSVVVAGDDDNDSLTVNDQGSKAGRLLTQGPNDVDISDTVSVKFVDVESLKVNRGPAPTGTGTTPPQISNVTFTRSIFAGKSAALSGQLVDPDNGQHINLFVDWGDGHIDKGKPDTKPFSLKHKFAKAGNYVVRVTWTDNTGRSNFRELKLKVKPPKAAVRRD